MVAPLSFHDFCHPAQPITFSTCPKTSCIIFDNFTFHRSAFSSLELLKQIKTAWRKFPPFLSAFARMWSQNELQCHVFKTARVTCNLWNASVTILVMFQWSCIQLFIYLFLHLYNPSPPVAQSRVWEEQKLFFCLRMTKRARELGRVLQRTALITMQYLDLQHHNLP